MKYVLKYVGVSLFAISIVLGLFYFLLENKEILFVIGIILIGGSYFIDNKK